jgi:hypothetical protein
MEILSGTDLLTASFQMPEQSNIDFGHFARAGDFFDFD